MGTYLKLCEVAPRSSTIIRVYRASVGTTAHMVVIRKVNQIARVKIGMWLGKSLAVPAR